MQQDITGAREGTLSPQLKESIAATHIADYEEIIRRAAYNLALTEGGCGKGEWKQVSSPKLQTASN